MTCFIKCPLPNQGWLMSLSCILPVDLQDCQLPNLQRTLSWTWRISAWEIFLLMLIGVRLDNQLRAMQIESLDTTLLPSSSYELLTCSLYWMKCLQLEPLSPMRMICSEQSDKFPANLRVLYWNDPVHYIRLQYITLHLKAKLPCWTLVSFITAAHPGSLIPASQMYGFYICIASYHQPTAWAGQLQPTSHLPTQADHGQALLSISPTTSFLLRHIRCPNPTLSCDEIVVLSITGHQWPVPCPTSLSSSPALSSPSVLNTLSGLTSINLAALHKYFQRNTAACR